MPLDRSRVTYIAQLRAVIERQLAEIGALGAPPSVPASPASAAPKGDDEDPSADARGRVKTPAWLESLVKE